MLRREVNDMIDLGERLLRANEVGVVATLFSSHGSTYRPVGSMMVSGPGSMIAGGVSGGCLEEYIGRHGRMLVQESQASLLTFDADPNGDDSFVPKLGCGGSIEVLVERLNAGHLEFFRDWAVVLKRDIPHSATCQMVVNVEGSIVVERTAFSDSANAAGNIGRILIHRVEPMTRLVIFGAGDDVRPLCAIGASLGWHVTVVDRRARRATQARFPDIDQLIAEDWDQAIPNITFSATTAVVFMTHSLADDIAILPLLQHKTMAYLGALGPAHRRQWVIDGAITTESLPEDYLERFRGPVGLNLGDRSPAGIALAIAAEITAVLNNRDARPLSQVIDKPSSPVLATSNG